MGNNGGTIPIDRSEGRPSLGRIGDKVAEVGVELRIVLTATDPTNDVLNFTLRSELPEGAYFNKPTQTFTWTPVPTQAGTAKLLTFEVSDGMLKDQETIRVEVRGAGQSEAFPPVIDELSDQSLRVGEPWSLQVLASDANNDPLTYSLLGTPPAGLEMNERTGMMSWTPTEESVGQHNLTVRVSDGVLNSDQPLRLIVNASDAPEVMPPRFVPLSPIEAEVGQVVSFQVEVTYEGEAPLTVSLDQGPNGAQFDANTRTFTWTPPSAQAVEVVFKATDGTFTDFTRVELIISEPPPPPVTCPTDPDPAGTTVTVDPLGDLLDSRVLCEMGEEDLYSLVLDEDAQIDLMVTFGEPNDIDLHLYDSLGNLVADSRDVNTTVEQIITPLTAGIYTIRVELFEGVAALYDLSLEVETSPDVEVQCTDDRFEVNNGNNSPSSASTISPNLYGNLTACADDDWYRVNTTPGYPVVVYISSADTNASLTAQSSNGSALNISFSSVPPTADGCAIPNAPVRASCLRAEIDPNGASQVLFTPEINNTTGTAYDLRVRLGDEASADCGAQGEGLCNPGYTCIEELNDLIFLYGTCTRACRSYSECGGSNRACIIDNSALGDDGFCLQGFECISTTTVEGGQVQVCHGL
jgi:hypothetical protein